LNYDALCIFSFLATVHSFVNARYSDISFDHNDYDAGFLITSRKKIKFYTAKSNDIWTKKDNNNNNNHKAS
jgi:hypothetical protein